MGAPSAGPGPSPRAKLLQLDPPLPARALDDLFRALNVPLPFGVEPAAGNGGLPGRSDIMAAVRAEEIAMEHRPWLASYPEGVPQSLAPYPDKSLYSLLTEAAARHPRAPAVAFWLPGAPMGKTLSYAQLVKQVDQFSRVLVSLGVQRGDRVGLVLPNCPQYVIGYFATLRIGAIVVGNNPLYTERELSHQLKDAGIEV